MIISSAKTLRAWQTSVCTFICVYVAEYIFLKNNVLTNDDFGARVWAEARGERGANVPCFNDEYE